MNRLLVLAGVSCVSVFLSSVAFGWQLTIPKGRTSRFGQNKSGLQGGGNLIPSAAAGWRSSSQSPTALADETDRSLGWLKSSACLTDVSFAGKDGHGINKSTTIIKDSKNFRVEYPIVIVEKTEKGGTGPVVVQGAIIANGARQASWMTGKGVYENLPLSAAKYSSQISPSKWTLEFPRIIFSAIRGGHPFGDLVRAVTSPGSGFSAKVQDRKFDFKGRVIHQKLLTLEKSNPKKGPAFQVKVTIDATQLLPVAILTTGTPQGRAPMEITWHASWGRLKPKAFNSQSFAIPDRDKVKH